MVKIALLAVAVALPAHAAAQEADAAVAVTRLPSRLECGRAFRASVTVLNTGGRSWTSADALAAVGGADAFTETVRVPIPDGVVVEPGQSHTFRFRLTAPEIPLPSARTAWRMVGADGVGFGETASQAVPVACPPRVDDAELVEDHLPVSLACGERYAGRITLRNAGTTRWTSREGYALGAGEDREAFGAAARLLLPEGSAVPPAADHAFAVRLVAPAAAGDYRLEWRMTRVGAGPFGPPVTQTVRVACTP
jgi:hypothetical protein